MGTQLHASYIDRAITREGAGGGGGGVVGGSLQLMCGLRSAEIPAAENCCHMGFSEAVNDSICACAARLIIGLSYTPRRITRCRTPICIPAQHRCFVSKYTNKFVIVKRVIFYLLAPSLMSSFNPRRRVWGGVQWPAEAAWKAGRVCRHQDAKSRIHRAAEAGLPVRGQRHGTI